MWGQELIAFQVLHDLPVHYVFILFSIIFKMIRLKWMQYTAAFTAYVEWFAILELRTEYCSEGLLTYTNHCSLSVVYYQLCIFCCLCEMPTSSGVTPNPRCSLSAKLGGKSKGTTPPDKLRVALSRMTPTTGTTISTTPCPDGIVSVDLLIDKFRNITSDLLNERVDAIVGEIESVRHACLDLDVRVSVLETENRNLKTTVEALTKKISTCRRPCVNDAK